MITGMATYEGTLSLADENPQLCYNKLGGFGVWVSQAGFGAYRIEETEEEHHRSLRKALLEGINLIDTSSMYTNGDSEKIIGKVLVQLVSEEKIKREQVVIVSKVGIIQGEDSSYAIKKEEAGEPYPDLITIQDGISFCIHPKYIQDQLTRSLERLRLSTIDCYLLHNPEYYLLWSKLNKVDRKQAYNEYLRRMKLAFCHLEKEVERGRIQCYGVSSNTFPGKSTEYEFNPLDDLWELAESISPAHHFKIVQFPMNLYEPGGILVKNLSQNRSVLSFTEEKKLGVLNNRSFDVLLKDKAFRLTDVEWDPGKDFNEKEMAGRVNDCIGHVEEIEDTFVYDLLPSLGLAEEGQKKVRQKIIAGILLRKYWKKLYSSFNVHSAESSLFMPALDEIENMLEELGKWNEQTQKWLLSYRSALKQTIEVIYNFYLPKDYQRALDIRLQLAQMGPIWKTADTLSQISLRILRATPEIHCSLVGMRREQYVEDVLGELKRPLNIFLQEQDWLAITNSLKHIIR